MARKHLPLLIGGVEVEIMGKGFRIITRHDGDREAWWYVAKRAVKLCYRPKNATSLRRPDRDGDVDALFKKCNDL